MFDPVNIKETFTCFDEMAQYSDSWDQRYRQPVQGRFTSTSSIVQTQRLQLSHTYFSPGIIVNGGVTKDCFTICVVAGHHEGVYGQGRHLGSTDIILGKPGQDLDFRSLHPCELWVLCISSSVAACIFEQLLLPNASLADFPDTLTFKSDLAKHYVLDTWRNIHSELESDTSSDLEAEAISALEVDATLALFRSINVKNGHSNKHFERYKGIHHYLDTRFIAVNRISDLSCKFGLSERTLRQGFKRSFGMSPKKIDSVIRLNFARSLILSSEQKPIISSIALKSGFTEFGRFAKEYKALFCETPRETHLSTK